MSEGPRSVYFKIKWNFLDTPINKRKLEKNSDTFILSLVNRCKDLNGRESQRIYCSALQYEGIWCFPEKDMVEIKELLEDCEYECLGMFCSNTEEEE